MWSKALRLLSDPVYFNEEREHVLSSYPELNSYGLGQVRRKRRRRFDDTAAVKQILEDYPPSLEDARSELREGGQCEQGLRNTLEYLVEAKISLSYHLRGCGWARSINGHAPSRRSSYSLKQSVDSYLQTRDKDRGQTDLVVERFTSNGAFICGALMTGIRMRRHRGSVCPDFRLGEPWAVAGIQPEDYAHPHDERFARFWRWAVQQDSEEAYVEEFIRTAVDLMYNGANLEKLHTSMQRGQTEFQEVYERFLREFGFDPDLTVAGGKTRTQRLGFLAGEFKVPDDFDEMGQKETERLFLAE